MDHGQTLCKNKTLIHICSSQSAKPQSYQHLITDSSSNVRPTSHLGLSRDSQMCPSQSHRCLASSQPTCRLPGHQSNQAALPVSHSPDCLESLPVTYFNRWGFRIRHNPKIRKEASKKQRWETLVVVAALSAVGRCGLVQGRAGNTWKFMSCNDREVLMNKWIHTPASLSFSGTFLK